jgi:predicted metalloprotease
MTKLGHPAGSMTVGDGRQAVRVHSIMKGLAVAAVTVVAGTGCVVVSGGTSGSDGGFFPGGGFRRQTTNTGEANGVVQRSLDDVERFWTATYPALADGDRFQAVKGGYHPYTRSDPPPGCGSAAGEYQPNAFYCPAGDFIAWDAEQLVPELHETFGPLLVGVVMAHEYGHAIQTRLGLSKQPTIVLEQQADCFAGAWIGDVLAGNSPVFKDIQADQLDNTVAGLLQLRDQPGTSAESPQAHGNAFDRVRAFQEGVELKAGRCAEYRNGKLPVTELPFSSEREAATGGDLAYEDAVQLLSTDVQTYWQRAYSELTNEQWRQLDVRAFDPADPPECEGRDTKSATAFYCAAGDYVAFDTRQLGPTLHRQIGDNAVGMLLGSLFAQAAQERRGRPTKGRDGQVAIDCLAGSWTRDLMVRDENAEVRLSPGDLDEAVTALLVFNRSAETRDASAFDRIAGFRKGVLQGLAACG